MVQTELQRRSEFNCCLLDLPWIRINNKKVKRKDTSRRAEWGLMIQYIEKR
jgi:hypothetical protein